MKTVHIKGDINLYSNNSLSILITQDGLSYSIFDVNDNKYQVLESIQFSNTDNRCQEIRDYLNNGNIINREYKNFNVVYSTKKTTLVPDVIFDEKSAETLFTTNHKLDCNETVRYSKLPKSESVVIYSVDKQVVSILDGLLPDYTLYPQTYSLIETYLTKTKIGEKPNRQRLIVQVFEDFFEILVINNCKIAGYNTYYYKTANDILYFIVNTFEQLGLSQEDCEVVFSGFIDMDDMTSLYLKKFVKTVYFESINRDCKYFFRFQEFAPHYFYNFLNINIQ